MKFITSKYIEILLDKEYKTQLKLMKKSMKNSELSRKYTAKAFVEVPSRIFHVKDNAIFVKWKEEILPVLDFSGKIYETDHDFDEEIQKFLEGISEYQVEFYFQTCLHYCGQTPNVFQARIIKSSGEVLEVSDEDKLDIACG